MHGTLVEMVSGYRDHGIQHGPPILNVGGFRVGVGFGLRLIIMQKEGILNYQELKEYMTAFQLGRISREEMGCAIHLWQRTLGASG